MLHNQFFDGLFIQALIMAIIVYFWSCSCHDESWRPRLFRVNTLALAITPISFYKKRKDVSYSLELN